MLQRFILRFRCTITLPRTYPVQRVIQSYCYAIPIAKEPRNSLRGQILKVHGSVILGLWRLPKGACHPGRWLPVSSPAGPRINLLNGTTSGSERNKKSKPIVGGRKKKADSKEENHSTKCYKATKVTIEDIHFTPTLSV